jgi:dTDP-glucose pyrophosphorylase/SAM-dependent methyltransferase
MTALVGVIPAAGRGVRAYPYTALIPKGMLEVDGVPLIRRNVELLRDQLDIRDIRVVIGHHGEAIRHHLEDGGWLGVRVTYVENSRLDLELPYSIYLGTRDLDGFCCVVLGDECYVGTNHRELLAEPYESALATCAFIESDNPNQIRKNYTATFTDGRIVSLAEKPRVVTSSLMGTGTYLLHPELIRRLVRAYEGDPANLPHDWTGWLGALCRSGVPMRAFHLRGGYVNVNSRDDLSRANYLVRDRNFTSRLVSLVYLLDDETDAAVAPILKFAAQPELHEVVVACRRRVQALDRLADLPTVRTVVAPTPDAEVGDLLRLGLEAARGDILVLGYSDDTFVPQDVPKLLVYLRDADMVVGTRTTRQLIEQGSNMRGLIRVVHVLLAKLVELLWWRFECRFSDICCVFRAFWRSTYESIRGQLTATGVEIFPELVLETLRARRRIIEIPVNYYNRDVETAYVRSPYQSGATLGRVLALIAQKRLHDLGLGRWRARPGRLPAPAVVAGEADSHRRMEREWQDSVGHDLLEKPHEAAGAALVFNRQFDWIADALRAAPPGPVVEVGCGRGHLLRRLREKPWLAARTLVGIDLSRAVFALRAPSLAGVRGDGESLPLRDGSVAALVYDGALHHLIDYPHGLREATRALAPGGILVLLEPVSSVFSRTVHRCLDPLVFRRVVYESPIDQLYKDRFREEVVVAVVREGLELRARTRSDFLAYPLTGCYAGSAFGRSVRFMRAMLAVEQLAWRVPGLRRIVGIVAWRFAIVAVNRRRPGRNACG